MLELRSLVMAKYQYHGLPANDYFRLATILPGNFNDDLVVTIEDRRFLIDDLPPYEALSYVWGSEDDKQPIQISNQANVMLHVTRNLAVALRCLRLVDRPRDMWVDAICIDQSNNDEKSLQVERMGEIYRLASRVIAWLGPEEDDSSHAMKWMHYVGSQITLDETQQLIPSEDCSDPDISDQHVKLPLTERDLRSVYYLICRPWFDRLWIRQEIYLANSEAVVRCGPQEVPWSAFHLALRCIHFKHHSDSELGDQCVRRLWQLQGFIFQFLPISFVDLRDILGNCLCRDPRDRIYALQSMLRETERKFCPRPDYTKPCTQLYQEIVQQMVSRTDNLSILRDCELAAGDPSPSWIPTWTRKTTNSLRSNPLLASSSIEAQYSFLENGTLRVAGVVATVVEDCRPIPDFYERMWRGVYEEARELLSTTQIDTQYCTGISVVEALARTLVCDAVEDNMRPSSDRGLDLAVAIQAIELMICNSENDEKFFDLVNPGRQFLIQMRSSISNKQFVNCAGGYVGIAPPSAEVGDKICVLLGCDAPMLLRPLDSGEFLVVGECFVEGLSMGEALLGPLPKHTRVAYVLDETSERWHPCYLDHKTGESFLEDPRLKELPIDLTEFRADLQENPNSAFKIELDILRQRGIDVRYLDLV
ncbi:HET-domain-containing protein [Xylaria cubensis]|nr:HET-domain-containing protein [Xylaria cubensis]